MSHHAEYDPVASRAGAPATAVLRPARRDDVEDLLRFDITVVTRTRDDWIDAIDKTERGERLLLVAEVAGRVGAFAQTHHLDEHALDRSPAGFYLTGVTVLQEFRRAGLACDLTVARLTWIAERAEEAWYFAAAENAASIRLHDEQGFVEVLRAPRIHGVNFAGGEGVLYRADLTGHEADPGRS